MKEAGLHLRVEEGLRRRFVAACQKQDLSASQVLRAFMRRFIQDTDAGQQQDLFDVTGDSREQS